MIAETQTPRRKAVIIGAGLAGFSLATELVHAGYEVEILEKEEYLGGRASNRIDPVSRDAVPIGPHVYVQWYNNFFRFLRVIGAKRNIEWEKDELLEMVHEGRHHSLRFYNLPAPFYVLPWIIQFPFMSLRDKLSNLRFAKTMYVLKPSDVEALDTATARDVMRRYGVSDRSIDTFWAFIVLSLLNIPIERCSGAEFVMLIKKWARLKNRRFGFPKVGLGDIFTVFARRYVEKHGSVVRTECTVTELHISDERMERISIIDRGVPRDIEADLFVSTLNPIQLRELLPTALLMSSEFFRPLTCFESVPYVSVNIWFDRKVTNKKFWAMMGDYRTGSQYINTDFYDFSNIYEKHSGGSYIASNIINSTVAAGLTDDAIVKQTLAEIQEANPLSEAVMIHASVHRIPYVVYAPLPGSRSHKRSHQTPIKNFYLAGDWTIREIPQCMEAAVRSGYKCAEAILRYDAGIERKICDDRVE